MWPCCATHEVGKQRTRVGVGSDGPGYSTRVKTQAFKKSFSFQGQQVLIERQPTSHMSSTSQNKNAGLQSM